MIPFHKLDLSYPDNKIANIIKSRMVVEGKYNNQLSEYFKKKCDVKYAIPCANCTSGLIIVIKALDIREKHRILLPAFTWFSTLYAAECNTKNIIFKDIDKQSWLIGGMINQDSIADLVIPVDVFGNKSYVNSWYSPVIYDAAHSYGIKGLGHRGIAEVVSFSYTKIVNGMQGGIILTNDKDMAEKCTDMVHKYAKLCEINALLVLENIKRFNNDVRLRIIDIYRETIKLPFTEQQIPEETNYSTYSILFETNEIRNKVANNFNKHNIGYKIYYEPLSNNLRNTNDIYSRILTLPVYKQLLNGMIKKVVYAINEAA